MDFSSRYLLYQYSNFFEKQFFFTLRSPFSYYVVSQIITCNVSMVKNLSIYIHIYGAGATLINNQLAIYDAIRKSRFCNLLKYDIYTEILVVYN